MKTFLNLYENQLDCVGKRDLDDALEYFSASKVAKILECEVEELMEFSTETFKGKALHAEIVSNGKYIKKVRDEFETGDLFVYKYKKIFVVLIVLSILDGISGGLIRERDIAKVTI